MSVFAACLKLNLKRIIKLEALIPAALLAVFLLIGAYIQRELELRVAVGVYFENPSEISREIDGNLEKFSNISIKRYSDAAKMLDDIAAVKIECGYIFDKDIDKYIETGAINRAARLYKSPSTVADGFTNELVFAALMKTASPYIAANYLNGKIEGSFNEILEEAKDANRLYYDSEIFLDIDVTEVGRREEAKSENRINTGVVSVFLFIMFFYITIGGIEEKKSGAFEKLPAKDGVLFLASYISAYAILLFVTVLALFAPGRESLRTAAVIGLYILALALLASFAAIFIKSTNIPYALFPVICVIVITLGGAFFDVSAVSPVLGKISRLFPTYYFCIYM